MDKERIIQSATDINNIVTTSFQSGKEHMERSLLAKIKKLETENKRLRGIILDIAHCDYIDQCAAVKNKLLESLKNS